MSKITLSPNWFCDGRELKPKSGSSTITWTFDGKKIKPKYGGTTKDIWEWDGRTLKPRYGANLNNTWEVVSNRIKPRNGSSPPTYDMNGQPILVAFGQLILRLW